LPNASAKKIVILTGARQTGKTTLAKSNYPQLRYINLDAPENRDAIRTIPTVNWSNHIGNAIIDEAQKEPDIFEKIKFSFDEKNITFSLLLGSSQILLLKKIRESLAGRVSIYELWPLMMSELIGKKPPLIDEILNSKNFNEIMEKYPSILFAKENTLCLEAENYLLQWGGMPALLWISKSEEKWKWLKDYEYTYLERDLSDLARLDDLEPFRKFQKLSALRSGHLLNYSELARDASVSVDTAQRYLEYLRLSYQVILLQPYYKNITSSVVKSPKLYWLDIGILRQLTGFRGELTREFYETMVVAELVKWIKTTQKDAEIYFYRTRSGLELDVLIETRHGFWGIEIKSRETVSVSDLRALKAVAKGLGKNWRGGIIVYRGQEIKKINEPDIWAIPSKRLFT